MDHQPAGAPPWGYTTPSPPPGDPLIGGDLGGWWSRAMRIVASGWKPLLTIQLVGLVPQALLLVPVVMLGSGDLDGPAPETIDGTTVALIAGYALFGVVVLLCVQAVVTAGAIHVATAVAVGRPARVGAAVRFALRRALPLLGWQFLAGLVAVVALCACVVPVFYVLTVVSILPAVVAFERGGALPRCFRLFHHRLDVSASRLVIAGLVSFGFLMSAQMMATIGDLFGSTGALGGMLGSIVVTALGGVLTVPLILTAYADIRAHAEPLSARDLAGELGL
jgi:hypothetical protein